MIPILISPGEAINGLAKLTETVKNYSVFRGYPEQLRKILDVADKEKIKRIYFSSGDTKLEIEYSDEKNTSKIVNEIEKTILQHLDKSAITEQLNKEAVIINAATELKNISNVSEEEVDQNWLGSFFEYAKHAHSDFMQKLWGKILADEIKKPNTYSIRALNTLKDLKQSEAKKLQELYSLLATTPKKEFYFFINNVEYLSKKGISQNDLTYLEELGLIKSHPTHFPTEIKSGCIYQDKDTFSISNITNALAIEMLGSKKYYSLTHLGTELKNLINEVTYNSDYIDIIARYLQTEVPQKTSSKS